MIFSPINKFFSLFSHDIGIDLGTANTLVFVKEKGIVIREPSVVAKHRKTKRIIAIGTDAKKMLGKTPASILTIRPLRGGVIADFDATEAMIAHYIKQVHEMGRALPRLLARPKVVIGIPSAVTEVERRAVWEAALSAGAREAYLIEEPMAAAIGEGISVFQSKGSMVVDIGGGTTEIAVISLGGIVVGRSIKLAGDDMDQTIVHSIRLRHGLVIGERTAEEIKMKIGSAYQKRIKSKLESTKEKLTEGNPHLEKMMIIRGRDIETGLPRSLKITEAEIREALSPIFSQITQAVADVLEETPPELLPDILEQGVLLTGGGAQLSGLDLLLAERIHMPVVVSNDSLTSVVRGTGKVLEDTDLLERVKVIGGLR
ncbi:MAG TPA: rod shape-determining protein [Candidatus Sulfotelmatobacter sp.]|jgi:rod shape-determining protein MreB|nr:rod shape-determining protein [Candidatus Sulfotelmatobacter sp.]